MKPISEVQKISRVLVDASNIRTFNNEHEFTGLSLDLLVEAGSYLCIAASLSPPPPNKWSRHDAVVIGHLARLYKLISALLDQTCQHRRETTFIFARLAFECIINILFLIKNNTEEVTNSYIEYSMRHEKRLRERILANINSRGGQPLHIEARMLRSIESSAKRSGVNLDLIKPQKNWAGKNLYEKAQDVGLEDAYLGAFAGPSNSVHGNWQDLLEYHLDSDEEGFIANLQWHRPRPQLLTTLAHLTVETLDVFFADTLDEEDNELSINVIDLRDRIAEAVHLHEEFLSKHENPV